MPFVLPRSSMECIHSSLRVLTQYAVESRNNTLNPGIMVFRTLPSILRFCLVMVRGVCLPHEIPCACPPDVSLFRRLCNGWKIFCYSVQRGALLPSYLTLARSVLRPTRSSFRASSVACPSVVRSRSTLTQSSDKKSTLYDQRHARTA